MLAAPLLVNAKTKRKRSLSRKGKTLPNRKKLTMLSKNYLPNRKLKNSITNSVSENSDALGISPITDIVNPSSIITDPLARIHEFTAPADKFDYSTLKPSSPTLTVGEGTFTHMGSESLRYHLRCNEYTAFHNLQESPCAPILFIHDLHKDAVCSPPNINVQWIGLMPAALADCHV